MTIRAELRALYATDMDVLGTYKPDNIEDFCVVVRAMVGPKGSKGEESFDINVCTPKWLAKKCQVEGFAVGRHYLIVGFYDLATIKTIILKLVEGCDGNSWEEVADKVSRIGYWEFEDYKPAPETQNNE